MLQEGLKSDLKKLSYEGLQECLKLSYEGLKSCLKRVLRGSLGTLKVSSMS